MQPAYISYVGWNAKHYQQGQFCMDRESLNSLVQETDKWRREQNENGTALVYYFKTKPEEILDDIGPPKIYSLIPGLNIVFGIYSIYASIFASDKQLLVIKDQVIACRLLLFTVGILEITWIGGAIIHGMASFYFWVSQS